MSKKKAKDHEKKLKPDKSEKQGKKARHETMQDRAATPPAAAAAKPASQEELSYPIGKPVSPLPPGSLPDLRMLYGCWINLEPLGQHHAAPLFQTLAKPEAQTDIWNYMAYGPFAEAEEFNQWVAEKTRSRDPWFYAFVRSSDHQPLGVGAFMRADPANGVIEIGHIWMTKDLQKTREATEAIYLMMRHAFDELGVRRLEWKCDSLNAPSAQAAARFGFQFEGIFRQHMIIKGRNRDTAWFAIVDKDWPRIRQAFEAWLRADNFDGSGQQKARLQAAHEPAIQQPQD